MKGPHFRDWGGTWQVCPFCGESIEDDSRGWELCPKAPDFTILPKPGQVWETSDGREFKWVMITSVGSFGSYAVASENSERSIYSKGRPNWPPCDWTLIKDADLNPWASAPPSTGRLRVLMEDDDIRMPEAEAG